MEAARNNSFVITIAGYYGNPVYRVVASIPIWVTCGRFPWKAPTMDTKQMVSSARKHTLTSVVGGQKTPYQAHCDRFSASSITQPEQF
jgi:hypothetical protein